MFQTWSWTFCETVSYKSTFRRSKQQHSRMQIMTQLRVLSMRIAEVPGPCETPAIQSQQDSLFPGKWNGSSVVDSRSFSHRMFSNLALIRCFHMFSVFRTFTEDEPWQAGVTQALQEKLGIHEADLDIPDIPDFQLATHLHTEKNDESTNRRIDRPCNAKDCTSARLTLCSDGFG